MIQTEEEWHNLKHYPTTCCSNKYHKENLQAGQCMSRPYRESAEYVQKRWRLRQFVRSPKSCAYTHITSRSYSAAVGSLSRCSLFANTSVCNHHRSALPLGSIRSKITYLCSDLLSPQANYIDRASAACRRS
jgi:hypothetical protein